MRENGMKQWLMNLLVCPVAECRNALKLEIYKSHMIESESGTVEEIDEALITCPKCGRWYPVIDGITCMMPDENRLNDKTQRKAETAFLERWRNRIPADIIENGVPFGLTAEPSDE
jgi:uncharacterized protein YbaR (Trm112 family)